MNFQALKEIVTTLKNGDFESIVILLLIISFALIFTYLTARFSKKAELNSLNENFNNQLNQHKQLLEATNKIANENFESIKSQQISLAAATTKISESLKRESTSHEIFLRSYHVKSIDAINEVYNALLKLHKSTKNLALFETKEHKNEVYGSTIEFIDILDKARIWLPISLLSKFDSHYEKMQTLTSNFIRANEKYQNLRNFNLKEDQIDQIIDDQEKFYDFIGGGLHTNTNELIIEIISFLCNPKAK